MSLAHAGVIIQGTRVIYLSNTRETTLQVNAEGGSPSLVQLWIDAGNIKSTPEESEAPFVITPPLSRIDSGKSQAFRIQALPTADELDQKQETLYWLNILDIPAKPYFNAELSDSNNYLQLAIRSRIKVFYRPSHLHKQAETAAGKLQWFKNENRLKVKNPTPFYITLKSIIQIQGQNHLNLLPRGQMLAPFSDSSVELSTDHYDKLSYISINDYGGDFEKKIEFQ